MTESDTLKAPDQNELAGWPVDGLESVAACPVCASPQRRVLYTGLRDHIFFCAPGQWTLHECSNCGSAYLDPRPTPETIHLAYQTYYTHQKEERPPAVNLHGLRRMQRVMANGYKNWRFDTNFKPANILGVLAAFLLPSKRAIMDREFRHLPPAPRGGRLLDVGFGDGRFMENARAAGWDVVGVDPDLEVVKNAREGGLNVYQGDLSTLDEEDNCFDVITMSHVIEHVHEPMAALRACYRFLKPGGRLWLETPNIRSLGCSRFQHHWRGLEPPRHLVLFDSRSMRMALRRAGFADIRDLPQPSACYFTYSMSQRMEKGFDPNVDRPISASLRTEIAVTRFAQMCLKSRREFVAIAARKKDN